jgi:hypothetical protein
MHRNGIPAERTAARIVRASGPAGLAMTAVALAATLTACGIRSAHGNRGTPHHGPEHTVLTSPGEAVSRDQPRQPSTAFQTTRTFYLGAGRATRTFNFRERSGVILRNQLTVRHGVRAFVDARIPDVAGAKVNSRASRNDPSSRCRRDGAFDVCTQGEEWCPMPQATWHFHLVKLSGPAGPIRFDYVVAAPPPQR